MALLNLLNAQLAYGEQPLLDRAALDMQERERLGLIGRNGTGKSTLLRVIAGLTSLDDGELKIRDGVRVVMVEQEPVLPATATLRESLIERGRLHDIADERERWRAEARLTEFIHRFELDEDARPESMSGGERKRGALALALACEPDLLLLDEPTNHLDIDAITRIEELLVKGPALIFITHDRAFLDRVATRIIELDRGLLRSYPGNYSQYEARKRDELAAEELANRRFDKFWAQEEAWIRKGVEARRTRNAGRVLRLQNLRTERSARRDRIGQIKLNVDSGERSGRLVIEATDLCKRFGERVIVDRLPLRILRGDRFGLIGPNGAGKSTLIKLLLGDLAPESGTVRIGANVQVAYFDQMREQLADDNTVAETISPGSDWVEIGGQRKHVMSYLAEFLFPPRRASAKVGALSGGERNRLLLARLFARPANVLVLDEPTNDLDIESLELLEATLQEYGGTLIVVSHDRRFLDNVVTQTLAAEGNGQWREYVGGYEDWLAQRPKVQTESARTLGTAPASIADRAAEPEPSRSREAGRVKLSFKEQRDLESLPKEIEALEREQHTLTAAMSEPDYHRRGTERIKTDQQRAAEIERLMEEKFARWAELEDKAKLAAAR